MRATYMNTTTSSTTPAVPVDANQATGDDGDRVIKKIFVGKPVAGGNITLFSINNALSNNTTQIMFKYTYPTFGAGTPAQQEFNFCVGDNAASSAQVDGLQVPGGGSIAIDQAMQLTVLWDLPEA